MARLLLVGAHLSYEMRSSLVENKPGWELSPGATKNRELGSPELNQSVNRNGIHEKRGVPNS